MHDIKAIRDNPAAFDLGLARRGLPPVAAELLKIDQSFVRDMLTDADDRGIVEGVIRLAGAFGSHIDVKYAMVLGMIPDVPLDKVVSAGNAAGTGARIALCNVGARNAIEATVHEIHKVETAIEPRFQEHFVNASAIPNAVDTFPELSKIVTLPDVSFNTSGSGGGADGGRRRRRG